MTGRVFGHFEIIDKLGEGGMGVLYRARDTRLGRTVAIKVLRPEVLADADRTRRFLQEARAASTLNHPCVVTVHDIGEDPDQGTWIAMECLDGESLKERLARGPLETKDALGIAVEVARGLEAAHSAGIVHRDVKPANVMITQSGLVKVLDFGLAKLVPGSADSDSMATTQSARGATGQGILLGTPAYMSPEQAAGAHADARSDVFSFGAMLYEMLTGKRPFDGTNEVSLLTAILRDTPPPVRSLRPSLDHALEKLVVRCLEKEPAERYASAGALLPDLEACRAKLAGPPVPVFMARPAKWAAVLLLLAVAAVSAWLYRRSARERWARTEALPEIQRLSDADQVHEAFRLAEQVRPVLRGDAAFERIWVDLVTAPFSVNTEPPGAEISMRPYEAPEATAWRKLGTSPIEGVELPRSFAVFRIEKAGYLPRDLAAAPMALVRYNPIRLVPQAEAPAGMVFVPGGPFKFRKAPEVQLSDFWLDRSEVTNRAFDAFVSGGGYKRRELWKHRFTRAGKELSFDEAMALFRDRTGRPGPATWELGTFPEGHGDLPVSGLSWYEAAAYAEFVGKSLPTFHHWYRGADLTRFSDVLSFSNFGGEGPRPVGQRPSLTTFGNVDMAGNVREWVWNAEGERRYTLGGAWSDPTYLYTGPDALAPLDRSPILGLRCALYPKAPPETAFGEITQPLRDLSKARPVDDATFQIYRRYFDYDPSNLTAKVESVDESPEHWRKEKLSFNAVYGGERIPALLYLPKNGRPPFQAVVYFPPGSALILRSHDRVGTREFDFLVRSGRAVLFPAYQQTYERRRQTGQRGPGYYREVITQRAQDVRRAIDYLSERPDIDKTRIAFYGLSMGAEEGTIVGAVDDRLRALLLVAGGLIDEMPPEVDGINFAPRIHVPVLMVNGRYDFASPYETSQKPLFALLGTPERDKRHAVFDSGHVAPWPDVVRESLDWLDKYLGPVEK